MRVSFRNNFPGPFVKVDDGYLSLDTEASPGIRL